MNSKKFPQVKIDKQKTTIEVPHADLVKFLARLVLRLTLSGLLSGSKAPMPPEQPPATPPIERHSIPPEQPLTILR
jgi:hypothetical protein